MKAMIKKVNLAEVEVMEDANTPIIVGGGCGVACGGGLCGGWCGGLACAGW